MFDPIDRRFFEALTAAASRLLGEDAACTQQAHRALASGDPQDLRAARLLVDDLAQADRATLLRDVHHQMASDLSAIWDHLPGAQDGRRQQ